MGKYKTNSFLLFKLKQNISKIKWKLSEMMKFFNEYPLLAGSKIMKLCGGEKRSSRADIAR